MNADGTPDRPAPPEPPDPTEAQVQRLLDVAERLRIEGVPTLCRSWLRLRGVVARVGEYAEYQRQREADDNAAWDVRQKAAEIASDLEHLLEGKS